MFRKNSTRKGLLLGLFIGIAFILALGTGYVTLNYHEVGGARWVVGGSIDVVSGGDLDIESGGSFKIAGTAVTLYKTAVLSAGDIAASSCYGTTLYGSDCDVNLPAAAADMDVTIYLDAAADVNINPDDADQIFVLTNAVGDAISSDAADGSFVHLKTIGDVNWICVGSAGTWADIN